MEGLYKPKFPSPLNPRAQTARLRPRAHARREVDVSPAQRLLRYKAAEAWRSHVLMREAMERELGVRAAETA